MAHLIASKLLSKIYSVRIHSIAAEAFLSETGQQDKVKNYKWEFNLIEDDKTVNA